MPRGGVRKHPLMRDFLKRQMGRRGCWIYPGPKHHFGYALHCDKGVQKVAHRVAFEISNGPIPPGLLVCHHCDNPPCCNPAHLFLGTAADNTRDAMSKGRLQLGEASPNAKLTSDAVRRIRKDPRWHKVIAAEYGVDKSLISRIKRREGWKHVD